MTDMPLILIATIWASFTRYAVWYLTLAKRNVAIMFDDAKTLREIHKKTPNAMVENGVPFQAEAQKFLVSNASVDTSTIKNVR